MAQKELGKMRSRITYLLHDVSQFEPSQIRVEKDSITLNQLDAAKEHRITFGFSELPQEARRFDSVRHSQAYQQLTDV